MGPGCRCQVVRSLDPCSKGLGFETIFRPITRCEERICWVSVIPGKKAIFETKGVVTLRGRTKVIVLPLVIESHCLISLPIQWVLCALHINQNLTKIVSVFAYQLSMHCLIILPIQWALCALHINQNLTKIVNVLPINYQQVNNKFNFK